MAERKRVNLTVSPTQKETWKAAVDESSEYSSISDLIRTSVAHELSDDDGNTEAVGPRTAEANTEALEQITETLTRMESSLNSVDERVENLENEVGTSESVDLKNEIFGILPHEGKVSVNEIAEQIDFDEMEEDNLIEQLGKIENTVEKLAEQTSMVERIETPEDDQAKYRRVD